MADKEKKYFWLKLPRNFFTKHYILIMRDEDNGDLLVLFYIWMLAESIDHDGRLRYSENIPYNEKRLASVSHFPLHIVTQALHLFTELELVVTESDGTIFLPKSLKMIGSESSSAQRVREYRARKDAEKKSAEIAVNTECNVGVTECNTSDAQCNTENRDKSKSIEKDNKKGESQKKKESQKEIFNRLLPDYQMTDCMKDKLDEWFKYKSERKQTYQESGMKALLKKVSKNAKIYGDTIICDLIDECMSSNWSGIIWDKLQNPKSESNKSSSGNITDAWRGL